jgi:hypothetical protein
LISMHGKISRHKDAQKHEMISQSHFCAFCAFCAFLWPILES